MFLEDLWDESVYVGADIEDLIVEALEGLALALKLNDPVDLVQTSLQPVLTHHLSYDVLSLIRVNLKEPAQFLKGNVLVDLGDHLNVVLNDSLVEHWIAFLWYSSLMHL